MGTMIVQSGYDATASRGCRNFVFRAYNAVKCTIGLPAAAGLPRILGEGSPAR